MPDLKVIEGEKPPERDERAYLEDDLIGRLLIGEPSDYLEAAAFCSEEDFADRQHRACWQVLGRLAKAGEPFVPGVVAIRLKADGIEKAVAYVSWMLGGDGQHTPGIPAMAPWAARQLRREATRAKLITTGERLQRQARNPMDDIEETAKTATTRIEEAVSGLATQDASASIGQALAAATKRVGVGGLSWGFRCLDNHSLRVEPGALVLLAARPGIGKTAMALCMTHALAGTDAAVLFVSLEMPAAQLAQRLLAVDTSIPLQKIIEGSLNEQQAESIAISTQVLSGCPIDMRCEPGLKPSTVKRLAAAMAAKNPDRPLVVVVDYLQLMGSDSKGESRQRDVSEISRALKLMALDLRCCVLALSQLSRAPETGGSREPKLSDLRDSGALEQDADAVIFLVPTNEEDDGQTREIRLVIAKHRQGPTGQAKLRFHAPTTRFME